MRNKPSYALASADSALLLATLLHQEGPMRVTDVAARLGVAMSTAHRLLGTLVYRDFAEQMPDRRYGPGRLMRGGVPPQAPVSRMRETALPHLRRLVGMTGETVSLTVLAGSDVRFVATVEGDQVLRVGDRTGRALPAHLSSGGMAILALLPAREVSAAVGALDEEASARLQRQLRTIRRTGFAINNQQTESGVTAVGVAIPDHKHTLSAAISMAMPSVRFSRHQVRGWVAALTKAASSVAFKLADDYSDERPREHTQVDGDSRPRLARYGESNGPI